MKSKVPHINYFNPTHAAQKYVLGRPDFHEQSMSRVCEYLPLDDKLEKALDIACGTGLSTKALLHIAQEVYGTDSSEAMIKLACNPDKINYQVAKADEQPFPNHFFNLITVCSGVHWFDIDSFLLEAHRILKPNSWLVLYDNFFMAEMKDNPSFKNWHDTVYLKRWPAPSRNDQYSWNAEHLSLKHFLYLGEQTFQNKVTFTLQELIAYFTSQSNIISAIENNQTHDEAVEYWLTQELTPFFHELDLSRTFYFGNWIKYLQPLNK